MRKSKRIWIKQEKRIVQLCYKKGLIGLKLKELYWAEYHLTKKRYKSKNGKYKYSEYFPEVFFGTSDYYGEYDDNGLVNYITEVLYWKHSFADEEIKGGEWPKSTFKFKSRKWFINYLNNLKTVKNDNKINKVVKKMLINY